MTGPLTGLRVVELAGLGPAPHACMQLATPAVRRGFNLWRWRPSVARWSSSSPWSIPFVEGGFGVRANVVHPLQKRVDTSRQLP
jgi:hypothetical protein